MKLFSYLGTSLLSDSDCWYGAVNDLFHMSSKLGHTENGFWCYQKDNCWCTTVVWRSFTWIYKFSFYSWRETSGFKYKVHFIFNDSLLILPLFVVLNFFSFSTLSERCICTCICTILFWIHIWWVYIIITTMIANRHTYALYLHRHIPS